MLKNAIFAFAAITLLAGCHSAAVRDARGSSEICEIHHTFMRSIEIPGPKGKANLPPEYVAAGLREFPHCLPDYPPDRSLRIMIYACPECVRAQRAWKQQHPGVFPDK